MRYLVAITEVDSFTEHTVQELRRIAGREGRSLVLVGATATELQLGWADFLDALGGAIPSWRALEAARFRVRALWWVSCF